MQSLNFQRNEGSSEGNIEFTTPASSPEPNKEIQNNNNDERENSALHFFLYLGAFFSLLFVSTGLGAILYQIVNKMFPDTVVGYSYMDTFAQSAVKFGLASLIIATPMYYVISYLIEKYLFEGKIQENSKVRKWTTYIILFIAFAIILGDLISLVFNWLGGDMGARFVLKVFIVLLISGSIFGYYFWDMRKKNMLGVKYAEDRMAGFLSLGLIAVVFFGSFFIVDSPTATRDKKNDAAITSQMSSYKYSISSYYQKNYTLPQSLMDLSSSGFSNSYPSDVKDNSVTYKKTGDFAYQLCATFKTSNMVPDKGGTSLPYSYDSNSDEWKHDKGNKCFDKELSASERQIRNMNNNSSGNNINYNNYQMPQQANPTSAQPIK